MKTSPSLIITVSLDEEQDHYFTNLRNTYYPKYCNYTPAHLTMLHRLPAELSLIDEVLQELTNRPVMQIDVTGITNMGNGVAYTVESADLSGVHKAMLDSFKPYLISKDRRPWQPHITVQNKVTAFKAMQTTQYLLEHFKPFPMMATGISVWYYLKGPWQLKQFYPFKKDTPVGTAGWAG